MYWFYHWHPNPEPLPRFPRSTHLLYLSITQWYRLWDDLYPFSINKWYFKYISLLVHQDPCRTTVKKSLVSLQSLPQLLMMHYARSPGVYLSWRVPTWPLWPFPVWQLQLLVKVKLTEPLLLHDYNLPQVFLGTTLNNRNFPINGEEESLLAMHHSLHSTKGKNVLLNSLARHDAILVALKFFCYYSLILFLLL